MKRSYIIILVVVVVLVIAGIVFLTNPHPSYAPTGVANQTVPTAANPAAGAPTAPGTATTQVFPVLFTMPSSSIGAYLVAVNGLALYTYSKDTSGVSNCTGPCATAWPPYIIPASQTPAAQTGIKGTVGSIARSGGLQITYNGMPLYFWTKDKKPGDITGQNVNGFMVAKP